MSRAAPYAPGWAPGARCVSLVLIGGGDDSSRPVEPVPSTVFGLAAYNGEAHIAEALESLLSQTRSDLAVVVVDDASTDATAEICARYVQHDSRVSYVRNDRQLGLSRNWQRAFELAGERHPAAHYFAWASDHDHLGAALARAARGRARGPRRGRARLPARCAGRRRRVRVPHA